MKVTQLATALLALLVPLAADARMSSTGASSVQFVASGPAGMRSDNGRFEVELWVRAAAKPLGTPLSDDED